MSYLGLMTALIGLITPPEGAEYMAIVPGAIVAVLAMIVIFVDTFHRAGTRRDYLAYVSAAGLGVAALSAWVLWDNSLPEATFFGMLYLDKFSLFFAALIAGVGALSVLQAPGYMPYIEMDRGEFHMLVVMSVAGAIWMASAADLLVMFIALEVMSIPIYCLAGYVRRDARSAEAAMKYFVLGAFSAGLMLYGVALLYGVTGTTNLEFIGTNLNALLAAGAAAAPETLAVGQGPLAEAELMIVVGGLLILSGLAFKVAAVPFHVWTPDVYTGAPTPAVSYMSTAVKAGAFAAMMRLLFIALEADALRGGFFGYGWVDVLFFLSAASMILGNAVAIMQNNVKRMLAYSSIAHAGYILLGLCAASARSEYFLHNDTVLFYLVTYAVGTVGAFGVLSVLGRRGHPVETYEDLAGLGLKYPFVGLMMGVFMFSSAGVPPTAGFVGKLYVFSSAIEVGSQTGEMSFIGLAILGVLTSVAGAYYYLRVLVFMYMRPATVSVPMTMSLSRAARGSIAACALLTLGFGILPGTLMELSREAIVDFEGAPARLLPVLEEGQNVIDALEVVDPAAGAPAVVVPAD